MQVPRRRHRAELNEAELEEAEENALSGSNGQGSYQKSLMQYYTKTKLAEAKKRPGLEYWRAADTRETAPPTEARAAVASHTMRGGALCAV